MEDYELESRMIQHGINPEISLAELSEKEKEEFFGNNAITLNFDLKIKETV